MSAAVKLLAVDIGAETGRVMVGHLDGGCLSLEELRRFPTIAISAGDGLFTDVLRIWGEIQEGLAQAAARYGDQLASVGVDTWGVDYALLSRSGRLLSNPRHYRDPRTAGMLDLAFSRVPREQIYDITGNQFEAFNTLYQLLATAEYEPELLEAAGGLLMLPDLFHYWLSGVVACEYTAATTTQCFNPTRRNWAWDVLDALQIPRRIFPPLIPPGTVLGPVQPVIARELGFTAPCKVQVIAPACHDTGSAVAAIPADTPDYAWISSGTWSVMGTNVDEPVIDDRSLQFNFTNEGGVGGVYRFSKNIMGLWLVQECRRTWASAGEERS